MLQKINICSVRKTLQQKSYSGVAINATKKKLFLVACFLVALQITPPILSVALFERNYKWFFL